MKKPISFLRGVPSQDALKNIFPDIVWAQNEVFGEFGTELLQYQTPGVADFKGFIPLKKILAKKYGLKDCEYERVVCTNGGMETISFIFKYFPHGSAIITEDATYDRVLSDAEKYGHRVIGIPLIKTGVNIKELKEAIENNAGVKIFYHIIHHQNPYGINASIENIESAAKLCSENGILYVCDIAYDELNYSGKKNKLPDLSKSIFENTCLVGSFTKTIAPGIKCGFGIFPKDISMFLAPIIANTRLNPNYPTQAIIWKLLISGRFDKNIQWLLNSYGEKMETLNFALSKHLPQIKMPKITGGFFALLELNNVKDKKSFIESVKKKGVIITPAKVYAPNSKKLTKKNFLPIRIAFPALTVEEIKKGIQIIAEEYNKL